MKRLPAYFFPLALLTQLVFFAPFICAAESGGRVAYEYPVAGLKRVVLSAESRVEIYQGEKDYLRIEATPDSMDKIHVDLTDGVLEVSHRKSDYRLTDWFTKNRESIRIVLGVKHIESLSLLGAIRISAAPLTFDDFSLSLRGASKGEFLDLKATKIHIELSGASAVNIKGSSRTERLHAEVSGASKLNAKNLFTKVSNVEVSGASFAEVAVSEKLVVDASGASKVGYHDLSENSSLQRQTKASGAAKVVAYKTQKSE